MSALCLDELPTAEREAIEAAHAKRLLAPLIQIATVDWLPPTETPP